jgi:hypothetical protein
MLIGLPIRLALRLSSGLATSIPSQSIISQDGSAVASQIIAALTVGLLIAFGVQLLLTNFAVAIGLFFARFHSLLQPRSAASTAESTIESNTEPAQLIQFNSIVPGVGVLTGLGTLLIINLALFVACFLAARFSQIHDLLSGVIVGLTIWAAYCLILLKLSTAVTASVIGKLLGFTVTGIGSLLGFVKQALQPSLDEKTLRQQVEVRLDTSELQKTFDAYVSKLAVPELEWERIRLDLENLVQQSNLEAAISSHSFNRDAIAELLQHRSQATDTQVNQVVNQLEQIWQNQNGKAEYATVDQNSNQDRAEETTAEWDESSHLEQIYTQLKSYLSATDIKKLTPKRIARKLKELLEAIPNSPLPPLNLDMLEAILQDRKSLTRKQRQQIMRQIQQVWVKTAVPVGATVARASVKAHREDKVTVPQADAVTLEGLIDNIAAYLNSAFELPQVTQQFKHSLVERFAHLKTDLPSWETLWQGREASIGQIWQAQLQKLTGDVLNDLSFHHLSEATQAALQSQMSRLQQQLSQPIEAMQQTIQVQVEELTRQAQQRLESLRQAAAKAAWWLFTIALTAALSSAMAAGLATG